jgi:hypothetical protein
MQIQVMKCNFCVTILVHVLPVVLLSRENHETGEERILGMIYVFHLSLQVSCPVQC